MMNRAFKLDPGAHTSPSNQFTDVTTAAIACGHAVPVRVETQLLRNYGIPAEIDDQCSFVSALIEVFYSALAEKTPALCISHGKWLSLYCEFAAQHRQKPLPEIINLRFVFGPCLSNSPSLIVRCVAPPSADEDAPF